MGASSIQASSEKEIEKIITLALAGEILAREQDESLEKTAEYCADGGHRDSRQPFHVDQATRMTQIRDSFWKTG